MFTILKKDKRTRARVGLLQTKHGVVETPSYVIVGTYAKVKALESSDIVASKTQMIICNTYHLWRLLKDGLDHFEGLHERLCWDGQIMTDSGGYQVFSLGEKRKYGDGKVINNDGDPIEESGKDGIVTVTEDGVYFTDDGEECYLDAETSIGIQAQLGADIIFAFDECTARNHDKEYTRKSMERTHRWAKRSLDAKTSDQILYGIVQGGPFKNLREESSKLIGNLPFEGLAIGGYLGTKQKMREVVEWCVPFLPETKPRHLLGIGAVDDLFNFVECGIDTFDCIIPTHYARNGIIWTSVGIIDIKRGRYAQDNSQIDTECMCPVCVSLHCNTKADLYWAFRQIPIFNGKRILRYEKNLEGGYCATLHNVFFFNNLMARIRQAIKEDRFLEFKKKFLTKFNRS
ncbi:MAG: tRNA guanosine(34) transglycosylase Tgt [Patescibacteria group bacterium]